MLCIRESGWSEVRGYEVWGMGYGEEGSRKSAIGNQKFIFKTLTALSENAVYDPIS